MPNDNPQGQPTANTSNENWEKTLQLYADIWDRRGDLASRDQGPATFSSTSVDVNNLIGNPELWNAIDESARVSQDKLLVENGIDPESFYSKNPKATTLDILRAVNYAGMNDSQAVRKNMLIAETATPEELKLISQRRDVQGSLWGKAGINMVEQAIADLKGVRGIEAPREGIGADWFETVDDFESSMEGVENQALQEFEADFVSKEVVKRLNDLIPQHIKDDPEQMGMFEKLFEQESGYSVDIDESGFIGGVKGEGRILGSQIAHNALAKVATDWIGATLDLSSEWFGTASRDERDEWYKSRVSEGELPTPMQAADNYDPFGSGTGLFMAALVSPQAREDYLQARSMSIPAKAKDLSQSWNAMFTERGASFGDWMGLAVDLTIESIPFLLEVGAARLGAKKILKKPLSAIDKKKPISKTRGIQTTITHPKTGKFLPKKVGEKLIRKNERFQNQLLNGGTMALAMPLVASHVHADNANEEWYKNLSASERASFLGVQSFGEIWPAMVMNKLIRGGSAGTSKRLSKMREDIINGEISAMRGWGRETVKGMFWGVGEEVFSEGATAMIQYYSEIVAKQQGGDRGAVIDWGEAKKRIGQSAVAAMIMAGPISFGGSGLRSGGAAWLASKNRNIAMGEKKIGEDASQVDSAQSNSSKKPLLERLYSAVQAHAGARSSMTRAFVRMSESNPEAFQKMLEVQNKINEWVELYQYNDNPEWRAEAEVKLKELIQEQIEIENGAFEGDLTFDQVVKEEAEALAKERKEKIEKATEPTAEERFEKAVNANESESVSASLAAAKMVNSAEQMADDSAQDTAADPSSDKSLSPDGKDTSKDRTSSKDSTDNKLKPDALKDERYKSIAEKANFLLRAFKGVISEVVIHTTAESYAEGIGADPRSVTGGKGAIVKPKDGSPAVIHINLSEAATNAKTIRHEFLHAAFISRNAKAKKKLLGQLIAIAGRLGEVDGVTVQQLIEAVDKAYEGKKGYDPKTDEGLEALNEEKIVTILEHFLDSGIFDSKIEQHVKLGKRILNAVNEFFGISKAKIEEIDIEDLVGFVQAFREAEKKGTEFKSDESVEADTAADGDTTMESRDLGLSKAYPDLQNSKVKYWVRQVNRLGGEMHNTKTKVFKDYWHFRNWWVQQTGNGKRAEMVGGFRYTNADGQKKTVNQPRPKLDRETGQPIDVQPLLKTINETKRESTERGFAKSDKAFNSSRAQKFISNVVNRVIDNEFNKEGDAYTLDSELVREPLEGFEVVETVEFTAEKTGKRYNTEAAEAQAKEYVQSIADMVPVGKGADYVFQVSADGDGKAKVELLVKDAAAFEQLKQEDSVEIKAEELQSLEISEDLDVELLESSVLKLEFDSEEYAGEKLEKISLAEMVGKFISLVYYDATNFDGESGIYNDFKNGFLLSFSTRSKAKEGIKELRQRAIDDYRKRRKADPNASLEGVIYIGTGIMGRAAMLSNRESTSRIIEVILDSITDAQAETLFEELNKDPNNQDILKMMIGAFQKAELDEDGEGWQDLEVGKKKAGGVENIESVPITKETLKEFLEAMNDNATMTSRNKIFTFILNESSGFAKLVPELAKNEAIRLERRGPLADLEGVVPLIKEFKYKLADIRGKLNLVDAEGNKMRATETKSKAFGWGIPFPEGTVKQYQPTHRLDLIDLLGKFKRKEGKKSPTISKEKSDAERKAKTAADRLKSFEDKRPEKSRENVRKAFDGVVESEKGKKKKKLSDRDLSFMLGSVEEKLNKEERSHLEKLRADYAAKRELTSTKASVKSLERALYGAEIANPEDAMHSLDLDLPGTGDVVKKAAKAAGKKGIAVSVLEAMKAKASKVEQAIINDVIAAVNMDAPEGRYVTEEQLEKAVSQRMLSPLEDESEFGDYGLDRIGRDEDAVDPSLTPLVGDTDHWGEASVEHTNQEAHAHIRTSGMKSDPQSLYVLEMQSDAVQKKNKKTGRSRVDIEDEVAQLFGSTTDNEAFVEDMGRNPDKYISEINDLKTDDKGNTANNYHYWGNLRRDLLYFGGFNPDNRAGYTVNKMIEAVLSKNPTFSVDGLDLIIKHYAVAMMGAPTDVTTEQAKKIFEDRWFGEIDSDLFEEGMGDIIADTTEDLMEMYNTLKGSMANPDVQEQPLGRLEEYYKVKESLKPKPEVEKKDRPIRKLWERHVINSAIQRAREKGKKKIKIPTGRTATAIQNWVKVEELEDMVSYKNQLTTGISVIHDRYSKAGSTMHKMGLQGIKLVKDSQGFEWHEALVPAEGDALTLFSEVLDFEGTDTKLPFEPNQLNYFQAIMARLDQLFANKYANVMRLQKDIQKGIGKAVELGQDFINAETLLYGRTANDLDKLDGKVKEISKEMKDSGLTSDEVTEYLIARHARERNAVIEERNGKKDGSGMSNADADAVINGLSAERKAKLDSLAKKIDAIQKDTRDTMRKYGLETNERIDAFEGMFKNYVPLGGVAIDDLNVESTSYPTGGAGITIYGDTTKRAKGRKSMAVNVLAQVIAQNAAVHTKARKNEALSSLHNLVKANPNERVWSIKDEVSVDSENAVGVRINGEQKYIVFNDASYAKSLKNMGVEKLDVISKLMRVPAAWLRRSFTTANPEFIISNFARDIQSALFNGLAEADIPGGQIQGRHIAAKIIGRVKNTLPALIKGTFGKDMGAEMEAYFDEFKEDGGQTGWGFVKPLNQIASEIEAESTEPGKVKKAVRWMAKHSIDVVENVNDAFENSIRLAAYIEAREAGVSRAKAAELAKNITVNFNRSGELGPVANAWYLFFNASVQGTVRLARSLGTLKDVRKPDGELESWHKRLNAAQKMAFGLSLTSGMLAAVNMAMSDEDEDGVLFYSKIPDYVKERNLIIMYDGKNHIKIPLPYGFNIFSNFGTAMAEVAGGQREMTEAAMFMSNSAFSSFSPISFGQSKDMAKYLQKGITPTVLKPLVEIATNETFFGGSVFRDQFPIGAPKPESELAFRSPEVIQSFFSWMNKSTGGSAQVPGSVDVNPDKFWYGLEYYIGGAGQFVTRSLGTGRDMFEMMKEGEKVKMSANDFPFLRKVYGESSRYYDSDSYTENSNLISQLYKERKESDDKRSDRYAGVTKLESMRKSTEKKLKALRKKRKEARDIKNYVDKQNRIYELYEKERSLLMRFNKAFEKYHGKK